MVGAQIIDRAHALRRARYALVPPIAVIIGIGEIHPAIGAHPNVVGAVERFALIAGRGQDHGVFPVGGDRPELVLFVAAGDQVALAVEILAVGPARRFDENGALVVGDAPLEDPVVVLVHEIHVAVRGDRDAFGEAEAGFDGRHRRAGRDGRTQIHRADLGPGWRRRRRDRDVVGRDGNGIGGQQR